MKWPASCSATIWVVGALIVLGLMLLLVEQPGLLLLEVLGALVLGGVFWGRGGSDHSGPTTPTEVQLVRGETAEVREVLEQLAALPPVEKEPLVLGSMKPLVTREEAEAQVADIKEAYGGLLSDDASETTAAELARALRVAFDTARANAEALGLTHLPSTARPPARRAVKALHLAKDAATPAERTLALERAADILGSLALYYLPEPNEARRMLGGAAPAIENPPQT